MIISRNIVKVIIVSVLFFLIGNSNASDVISNRNEQEGLLFLNVSSIVKDHKGFMWFGTYKGLNRWDGYKYNYFLSDKNDSTTISSNKIQSLLIDREDYLWIATPNGLNRYNPETESFTRFTNNRQNPKSISSNSITCLDEDKDGNLWIGTEDGINVYNKTSNTFLRIDVNQLINIPNENYSTIRYLSCDSEGFVWVGFHVSGICRINSKTLEHTFILKDDFGNFINSVNDIADLGNDNLLIATWGNQIFNLERKTFSVKPWEGNKFLKSKVIDFIDIDKFGNFWIADHYQQVLNISSKLELINAYSTNSTSNKIPSSQISTTYVEDDNIWFGTLNQGFFYINNSKKRINNLSGISPSLNVLANIQVTAMAQNNKGDIFIGTSNNNLFIYNEISGSLKKISLSNDILSRLYFDEVNNWLYLGYYSSSICYLDLNTFEEKTLAQYSSNYGQVNAYRKDRLYVPIWGQGITAVDANKSIEFLGKEKWERSFSTLSMIGEDSLIWIASFNDGIIKYNIKENTFNRFLIEDETKSLFATNQVNLIKRLRNKKFLVTSNDLGLCYFDEKSNNYTQVGIETGINNVHAKAILEDDESIWIISEQKIIKTNENFDILSTYSIYDGLNFGIEHLAALFSSVSKRIYLGGQEGIQFINTDEHLFDSTSSNVVITDLKIYENTVPLKSKILNGKSISFTDTITLNYKENFITIDFSQMLYSDKSQSFYSYKLEGVNSDWITVPYNRNSVTYSNLSHGKYTFLVRASNKRGELSKETTRLYIKITPPFWDTPLFRIFFIILIIVSISGYIKLKTIKYRKEKKKLEQLIQERTLEILDKNRKLESQKDELIKANEVKNVFFNIIAHDLKNPVASFVQLTELAQENFKSLSSDQLLEIINTSANSANSTLELLEDLLLWARSQINKIDYQFEKLNIIDLAKHEITNLALQALNKQTTIINNLPPNLFVLADANSVKTIFRNLLSNAIKFSKTGGIIHIGCHLKGNEVTIYVKDNGTGMKGSTLQNLFVLGEKQSTEGTSGEKGSGLGLNLCKEFVEKNGGKIWAESTINVGSSFFFTLPVHNREA